MTTTGAPSAPPDPHHAHVPHAMDHDTAIDITALEAEVDALLAQDAAQAERIEALLATGSTAVRMADLAIRMEQGARELAVQERYQRRIARAMGAL